MSEANFQETQLPLKIQQSLIKYESPIPVANEEAYFKAKATVKIQGKIKPKQIVGILLPPRSFSVNQQTYIQHANCGRPSRSDVDSLKQKMEQLLIEKKAAEQPVCPIRAEIFSEAFEEIIRQVVLDCPERGVLLNRVKNEINITLSTYQTLYRESVRFSQKKLTQYEGDLQDLSAEFEELQKRQTELREKEKYLHSKRQSLELKVREVDSVMKEKYMHESEGLEFQEAHLASFVSYIKSIRQEEVGVNNQATGDQDLPEVLPM